MTLCFYYLEFNVWMVDEKSLVVLPFEPVHSYSNFIASMWFQMYNGRDAFSISLRNTRENSHMKIVIRENISLSTARYYNVICLTKAVFMIYRNTFTQAHNGTICNNINSGYPFVENRTFSLVLNGKLIQLFQLGRVIDWSDDKALIWKVLFVTKNN